MPAQVTDRPNNNWDIIAERFNTHIELGQIHPDAAVNILVGWPVFFEQVKYHSAFLGKSSCNILDLGCGAGDFCVKLNALGHKVVGVDASQEMLSVARKNSPQEIEYVHGDCTKEDQVFELYKNRMDIISSMHSLDWIEDMEGVLKQLTSVLVDDGLILFAVFPKKHVVDSIEICDLFEDFDSHENPYEGVCNFDGVKIPVYVRDAKYYDELFSKLNCEKVLEYYPPYPQNFFEMFNWTGSKQPEMLIMGYQKKAV